MTGTQPPWHGRRLHLVGIGGAGMSAYAHAAHALGASVSGSDAVSTPYLERLAADGVVRASVGHAAENVPDGDDVELFYSSAVAPENPERRAARERGLSERPRAELLAQLSALRKTIAVGGTHGKTTTASMIVHALRGAGLDPGWLVGGPIGAGLANAGWSEGEWLVVEADESDRSMLSLSVQIAIVTNIELDHHETFASLSQLHMAFAEFLALARQGVVVWDRPELLALVSAGVERDADGSAAGASEVDPAAVDRSAEPAAVDPAAADAAELIAYDVPAPTLVPGGSRFDWHGRQVSLAVPGAHNALNAAAALEAARLAGAQADGAIAGLADFHGAGRRFELLGRSARGALVYDDYAHHPTEVAATLDAARTLDHERLVAVFQPHLYTRTELFATDFGRALARADVVIVLDVYAARERAAEHPGVTGLLIAEACADAAHGRPVYWLPAFDDAERALSQLLGENDLCVAMGAGDIDELARRLLSA